MPLILEPRAKTALACNDQALSYEGLLRRARAWARCLGGSGERVALFAENGFDWAAAAYAAWAAQQVLVPVDHLSTPEELAYVLDDCAPATIFCSRKTRPVVERALALSRQRPRVLDVGERPGGDDDPAPADAAATAPLGVDESAVALVVYTSGTTGSPKGVVLSFGNLLANIRAVADEGYYTPDARVLLLLPLHHVLPLVGCLVAPLFTGSTVVFAGSLAGEELVATLQRHAITTIVAVPRFYELLGRAFGARIAARRLASGLLALAGRVRSRRFSRLVFGSLHRRLGGAVRHLISGGAALDPETARLFDRLGFLVCEGYGMTECAPMIAFPRLRGAPLKLGSCGQALRGCELRIEKGEILARGPNVMQGYYGRAAETAEVLRDGWIHTGDLGRLDDDGFLYVTGRLKEILVLPSGKNVNPVTIEAELQAASPAVREAGVFQDGETLHALVVADCDGPEWLRREVLAPYNARVAPYKRVARATLVPGELPRTRLGKLKRHQLKAIAAAHAGTAEPELAGTDVADPVVAAIAAFLERHCRQPVRPGSRLDADLGLDSLGRVELAAFLERAFGIDAPEARLAEAETVADVARLAAGGGTPAHGGETVSWREILSPERPPPLPRSSGWHRLIVHASRGLLRACFRVRARGLERLPASPCILAVNHQSFLDGLFVTAHLPPARVLRTLFYAKAKHVDRGWLRFLAGRCNVVIASADEGFRGSLQKLAAGLRRGDSVIIFPEGTRSPDGSLGPFRESYAILARELDLAVVPLVIDGAQRALPPGRRLPRLFAEVSVTCLEPLRSRPEETLAEFNRRVRDSVAAELARGRGQPGP